jgi:hypothetical protein
MASKPDKFGIKFWIAADVKSKYLVNGIPYLGKDETRSANERLSENVVMCLMTPYMGKGRNVTTDNFFTSVNLGQKLMAKNTTLVGTVNRIRREIPVAVKNSCAIRYTTNVLKCKGSTLTVYQVKHKENVILLSALHSSVAIGEGNKNFLKLLATTTLPNMAWTCWIKWPESTVQKWRHDDGLFTCSITS